MIDIPKEAQSIVGEEEGGGDGVDQGDLVTPAEDLVLKPE